MKTPTFLVSALCALAISGPTFADVQVEFREGAPKDRFAITNVANCALGPAQFEIDFTDSNAGLIFDVTNAGAGVEVFQPFEITAGGQHLVAQPTISDGDQTALLDITGLGQNKTLAFTIDVDDTIGTRAITVANSEISGTRFSLYAAGHTYSTVMKAGTATTIETPDCDA